MATFTDRPTATAADGYVQSDSATYSTSRTTYVAGFSNSGATTMIAGQEFSGGTHKSIQAFLRPSLATFDPSWVPVSGYIEYTTHASAVSAVGLQWLLYDAGTSVATGDFRDGSTLSGFTQVATAPSTNSSVNTTYQAPLTAAGLAAVVAAAGGNLGLIIVSDDQISGTPSGGAARVTMCSSNHATEANRPALIIEYEIPVDHTLDVNDATISADDALANDVGTVPADTVGGSDSSVSDISAAWADTAAGSDALANSVAAAWADTAAGADTLANTISVSLADATTSADDSILAELTAGPGAFTLDVADQVVLLEAYSAAVAKPLTDTAAAGDAQTRATLTISTDVEIDICAGISVIVTDQDICAYAELDE